ncbi:TetR/AcrR family transcriptional regulator [Dietzia aurantiaca]|uniref:TetR/AcrR family transcriptional regulator n=1 Tax=Dietzia aurantiaca TaxID=983873 RepID=UPI001E5FE51B|nr:TetR/AcrR family transcriptional regulator [Dietzia aurantiaca]MCD2264149.1 TetR/AcrR family transcriptional regulator [Dietzia aurantiaca]
MSPAAPSGSTSPRGDRRREDILSALDERLKTTALDDISVADLTEAAGITRSAFYFYFDSKAAAVSMLLVVVNKEAGEAIDIIVGGEGDFRRRVTAGLTRLIDRVLEVDHIYRALLTARTKHEPTREMWDAGRRYNAAPVADFIRAERAAGRAPDGADAQSLAEGLMQLNQQILERVVYEPGAPRDALLAITTDMWVRTVYGRIDPAVDPAGATDAALTAGSAE